MKPFFQFSLQDEILVSLQVFCRDQYENLKKVHKSFIRQITFQSESSKENMLEYIQTMTFSYEVLLIDFCNECENNGFSELGKFVMKLFVQLMSCMKWIGKLFLKCCSSEVSTKFDEQPKLQEQKEEKTQKDYYRMRQNSKFMVDGINKQITNLQKYTNQNTEISDQIQEALSKKQKIESIKESNNQLILFEAVTNIQNKSQAFNSFVEINLQNLEKRAENIRVQPFSILRNSFELDSDRKLKSAHSKIHRSLNQFIKKFEKKKISSDSRGCQVQIQNRFIHKLEEECRQKERTLKALKVEINFQTNTIQKLEGLVRQKAIKIEDQESRIRTMIVAKSQIHKKIQDSSFKDNQEQIKQFGILQTPNLVEIARKKTNKVKVNRSVQKIKHKQFPTSNILLSEKLMQQKNVLCSKITNFTYYCDSITTNKIQLKTKSIQTDEFKPKLTLMTKTFSYFYEKIETCLQSQTIQPLNIAKSKRKQSLISIINIGSVMSKRNEFKKSHFDIFKNQIQDKQSNSPQQEDKEFIYKRRKEGLTHSLQKQSKRGEFQKLNFTNISNVKRKNPFQIILTQKKKKAKQNFKANLPIKIIKLQIEDLTNLFTTPEKAFQYEFMSENTENFNLLHDENSLEIKAFVKTLFQILSFLKRKNEENYKKIKNFLRYPYSFIYHKDNKQIKRLSEFKGSFTYLQVYNVVQNIVPLHLQCQSFPCLHIKKFLEKFGFSLL